MSLRFSLALLLMAAMSQMLPQTEGKKKLCGEALNEALDLICVNGFSRRFRRDLNTIQRTPEQILTRKWRLLALRQELDSIEQGPATEQTNENNSGRELRRPRRRITQECCEQGCTYEYIMEYCA